MNLVLIWGYRLFVAVLLGGGIAYAFHREWSYEQQVALTGCTSRDSSARSTVIWLTPWSLPIVVAVLWLITLIYAGPAVGAAVLTEFSLQLMVLLTFYFGALMLLLPLLRRKISARACATLWLLPVFLYYNLTVWRMSYLPPLVVLRVPSGVVPMLLGLWAAGFVAVVLCSGLVGVSGSYGTLGEVALASYGPDYRVSSVSIDGRTRYHSQRDMDPQISGTLLDYLSALPVTKLATGQTVSDSEGSHLSAFVSAGDAYLFLNLTDQLCSVQDVNSDQISAVLCRVDGPVDWDYLESLRK